MNHRNTSSGCLSHIFMYMSRKPVPLRYHRRVEGGADRHFVRKQPGVEEPGAKQKQEDLERAVDGVEIGKDPACLGQGRGVILQTVLSRAEDVAQQVVVPNERLYVHEEDLLVLGA